MASVGSPFTSSGVTSVVLPDVVARVLAREAVAASVARQARGAVAWVSVHTGIPALVVAAVLVVVGYRVLKRSLRFFVEVALVVAALVAASHLGWLRF